MKMEVEGWSRVGWERMWERTAVKEEMELWAKEKRCEVAVRLARMPSWTEAWIS